MDQEKDQPLVDEELAVAVGGEGGAGGPVKDGIFQQEDEYIAEPEPPKGHAV